METAAETRPKALGIVGAVAALSIGWLTVLVMLSTVRSSLAGCFGAAFLALGIVSLARTRRFRWWQLILVVLATLVACALLLLLAVAALVLVIFGR